MVYGLEIGRERLARPEECMLYSLMIIIVVFWFRIPLDFFFIFFSFLMICNFIHNRVKGVKGNLSMYKE